MSQQLIFRKTTHKDVPLLVNMLADDELGKTREKNSSPLPESYYSAFQAIDDDPNNQLIVVELENQIVGMMQITYIPYLTYQGGWRALIEGVRVSREYRGEGLGQQMFEWGIEQAKLRHCHMVQLTTDKKRPQSISFYKKLGFINSHEGMKLHLDKQTE